MSGPPGVVEVVDVGPPGDAGLGSAPVGAWQWWDHAPCALLVLDAEAAVVREVNQTFLAWSGLERSDVLGAAFSRLLPVGDRILWSTHCLPKLETSGWVAEVSVQVLGAGQQRCAAFLTARRLHDGEPDAADPRAQVLVALFGATERRRYEEDLLEATRRAEASEAQRARAEEGLQHLAHHDPVTGLLNRRGLQLAMEAALATAARGTPPSAAAGAGPVVLFVDLDGFKAVNDSVGHAGGDELLVTIAHRIRNVVRREAVVARFAGDEFVVVDHLSVRTDVDGLCRRLLQALAEPTLVRGVEVVLTASIGVAFAQDDPPGPTDDASAGTDGLLHRADAAMYHVKGSGRSGWYVHDPTTGDRAADRLQLLEQLRHAAHTDELRLHYQPRVRLADGATTGVEALVRWQHPTRGLLGPDAFIDVAETSGVIRDLGAWVLRTALAQTATWNAAGRRLQVSVNISARQLIDPELLHVVTTALALSGVPASQLVLEITETSLMVDPLTATSTLERLCDLGATVAVDDFGTGYASLSYLRRFPVRELKIDRSFVATMTHHDGDRAIVAGCVQLARALGLTSVAEGVETAEQRAALLDMGCDLAQGYLFSRPLPAGQLFQDGAATAG